MQDDDWGCVSASDLFTTTGKTTSLQLLVAQLDKNVQSPMAMSENADESSSEHNSSDNTMSSTKSRSEGRPIAKKILKKRTATGARVPNLKHVTFEIESFVNTHISPGEDRQKAEEQLAIRLGAKPLKQKPINYKQLKDEKQRAKDASKNYGDGLGVDRFTLLRQLLPRTRGKDGKKERGFKRRR